MAIFIIIVIIVAFSYYVSLKSHPLTKCKACNGTARHFSSVYTDAHRRCRKCGGTGRRDRLGVRLFMRSGKS